MNEASHDRGRQGQLDPDQSRRLDRRGCSAVEGAAAHHTRGLLAGWLFHNLAQQYPVANPRRPEGRVSGLGHDLECKIIHGTAARSPKAFGAAARFPDVSGAEPRELWTCTIRRCLGRPILRAAQPREDPSGCVTDADVAIHGQLAPPARTRPRRPPRPALVAALTTPCRAGQAPGACRNRRSRVGLPGPDLRHVCRPLH